MVYVVHPLPVCFNSNVFKGHVTGRPTQTHLYLLSLLMFNDDTWLTICELENAYGSIHYFILIATLLVEYNSIYSIY
jgi:hypothetical protein